MPPWIDAAAGATSILVAVTILMTAAVKGFRVMARVDSVVGIDKDGKTLRDHVTEQSSKQDAQATELAAVGSKVRELETILNNGLRTQIAEAVVEAREARRLAGAAAASSSSAHQEATDARRASAAARADISVIGDAVASDSAKLWDAMSELGIDRRRRDT